MNTREALNNAQCRQSDSVKGKICLSAMKPGRTLGHLKKKGPALHDQTPRGKRIPFYTTQPETGKQEQVQKRGIRRDWMD